MSRSFNCPNCGGPIDYKEEGELTVRCPFCNNSVIVPEELRTPKQVVAPPAETTQPSTTPPSPVLERLKDLASQSNDPHELRRIAKVRAAHHPPPGTG